MHEEGETMAVSFKGAHFPPEIILMGVRWYLAYPLSTRHVEELMAERGVTVDHSTINRWVIKYSPQLEEAFHRRKRPVWISWRLDETYIRVKGQWKYVYRAVDKHGKTIDFLLTEHRDAEAALKFLKKAIRRNGLPETITIDGSTANDAAIKRYNQEHGTAIAIRQVKYLNNIVEQDHRAVKRVTRPMLGFKSFHAAHCTLVGIELMHMPKRNSCGSGRKTKASLRLNCSTPWRLKPPPRPGQLPLHGFLSKICDTTFNVPPRRLVTAAGA
jgi:putative transposase